MQTASRAAVRVAALLVILIAALVGAAGTLRAELPGYGEYVGRTRYRLLPGVW